jgi:hypothetical protein
MARYSIGCDTSVSDGLDASCHKDAMDYKLTFMKMYRNVVIHVRLEVCTLFWGESILVSKLDVTFHHWQCPFEALVMDIPTQTMSDTFIHKRSSFIM